MSDKSNGYESHASDFLTTRSKTVGVASVRRWVQSLQPSATVLDIGCGGGYPITNVLIDEGMLVYAMDASRTLVKTFQERFPEVPVACEAVEDSSFFHRKFEGIVAWGLLFLLEDAAQRKVLERISTALKVGGKLLFTSPRQRVEWQDLLTRRNSISLGAETYKKILSDLGLSVIEEFEDDSGNYYYNAVKM